MLFAIKHESLHYRYYLTLKKCWGFSSWREESRKQIGLCVYTQSLFWLTILTVVLSLPIAIGWILLKLGRLFYKFCSLTSSGRFIVNCLDRLWDLGDKIADASDLISDKAIFILLGVFFTALMVLCVIISALILLTGGATFLILYISAIPGFLWGCILGLGLAWFYMLFGIGYVLCAVGQGIIIALKIIGLFLLVAAPIMLSILIIILVATVMILILIKMATRIKCIREFLVFKFNGFQEAREEIAKRRKELTEQTLILRSQQKIKRSKLREKKQKGEIPYSLTEKVFMIFEHIFSKIGNWTGMVFFSTTTICKDRTYKMMGIFPIIGASIKSIYTGICPIMEILDEEDFEEENQ